MTKLKKFTIGCAVVFLACMIAVFALLPLCVDDLIDEYNEIINKPINNVYKEHVLDENIKNIRLPSYYYYIETRKSPDNLIHIQTLDAGLMKIEHTVQQNEDTADIWFNRNYLNPINKENITRLIKLALNDVPSVILYMPEDVSLVSYYFNVRNPYTLKNYPMIDDSRQDMVIEDQISESNNYTSENIIVIGNNQYSKEYLSDRTNLINLFNQNKNDLMNLYLAVDEIDLELSGASEEEINTLIGYMDIYNSAYIDILNKRLDIVKIASMANEDIDKAYMENLVYALTNFEQSVSISNLKIKIAFAKYKTGVSTREKYNDVKSEEENIIATCNKNIPLLTEQFNNVVNFLK